MVKETTLSKCIKDCKLTKFGKNICIAFICIDSKGRSFILYYSVKNLSEQNINSYENLPILGFESDLDQTNAVYLLHTDGKISVRLYQTISHDFISKIDQFQISDQLTPLCPSLCVSFNGKNFYCIADDQKIHKYCYYVKSDNTIAILSDSVEYFNSPIHYIEKISANTNDNTKNNIENSFLWSGHDNGFLTIWSFTVCIILL